MHCCPSPSGPSQPFPPSPPQGPVIGERDIPQFAFIRQAAAAALQVGLCLRGFVRAGWG